MFPMDFEEFLWAMDDDMMMEFIRKQFARRQPMGALHRKAMGLFPAVYDCGWNAASCTGICRFERF
jgi:hypothetical protein